MPTLPWKLKDPKSCEGCPFLMKMDGSCEIRSEFIHWDTEARKETRPQACTDELGE